MVGADPGTLVPLIIPKQELDPSLPAAEEATASTGDSTLPLALWTLGCKVNQYETQYALELLTANGYHLAQPGEVARLAVVNTCTVTAESDAKSRQLIRRVLKNHPGTQLVVMGCYATRAPEEIRRLPGVSAVITDKRELATALRPFGVRKTVSGISRFAGRQRAFLKAQDGCVLRCSFCVIPNVRPHLSSRPMDDLLEEARALIDAGFRELVLCGIHLGHYGIDLSRDRPRREWRRLWHLLDRLATLPGEYRIRLSSLEASEVTDDFIAVLAAHPERICPHLHLSLQSGSDRVLAAMRRRYRMKNFRGRCDAIRQRLDQPALTTDIIVGFPGETDADFNDTAASVAELGFSKLHVFPFSARDGTPAAELNERVPPAVVAERRAILADVERSTAQRYHESLLGRKLDMLVEGGEADASGWRRGTACRAAPLFLKTTEGTVGRLVPVVARNVRSDGLEVEPWIDLRGENHPTEAASALA